MAARKPLRGRRCLHARHIRHALRGFHRSPAFAAVLSLTLGIGANTAIFSLVNAPMLRHTARARGGRNDTGDLGVTARSLRSIRILRGTK